MPRMPLVAVSLLLFAAPLFADAGPIFPWERTRVRGPDEYTYLVIERSRTAMAALGGGPALVAEFRHPDGRPLDWERRLGERNPGGVACTAAAAALFVLAVVLAGLYTVRYARRSRERHGANVMPTAVIADCGPSLPTRGDDALIPAGLAVVALVLGGLWLARRVRRGRNRPASGGRESPEATNGGRPS